MPSRQPTFATSMRTHTCGGLREADVGETVKLAGWVHRKRDHGQLLFVDLRDHYGITQCVLDSSSPLLEEAEELPLETVVQITGPVVHRPPETVNPSLPTGHVEVQIHSIEVMSRARMLPFPVNADVETSEELRLRYRYLDLRRPKMHRNIVLRSQVINAFRRKMTERGFTEFQTPILTASSPEGARDFLVPSRIHPGKFFALPQAPQQFKQLVMIAGFDRYFQIAPCFRDEAARADRSPGEHYQLDLEMSYVSQEDLFDTVEPVLAEVFEEFGEGLPVTAPPFPRIPYQEALLRYGTDKPDLRNPILIEDVTDVFRRDDVSFRIFVESVAKGAQVRCMKARGAAAKPRSWFDGLNDWARAEGAGGLAYIILGDDGREPKGPIAKFFSQDAFDDLRHRLKAGAGDVLFFLCDRSPAVDWMAGKARERLGWELDLIHRDRFEFLWVVDFPFYEWDEEAGRIEFGHNPFSMPQGGLEALETQDPLSIKAFQYDIVCNGAELSSGAVRNHLPEVMYRAFEIVGYAREEVERRFGGLLTALKYGAPPHAGCAPGIDRMVMLLADEPAIREVIAFPMTQNQQDLMMQAPSEVPEERLAELSIRLRQPKQTKQAKPAKQAKG